MRRFFLEGVDGWFSRATIFVLVVAGSACSDGIGPETQLDDARALWEAAGTSSYSFELQPVCFCGASANALVVVEDGVVTSVFDLTEERFLELNQAQLYVTVEALFDLLGDAEAQDAHFIRAEYHPVLGFPTDFFIDYSENAIDEELGYLARGLTID